MADVRLTAKQQAELAGTAKDQIREAHVMLDRAARAGLDVEAYRADLVQAESLRQGLLAEFGPQRTR